MKLKDELTFNLDVDLEANDMARWGLGTSRCHSKSRFPPCLAGAKAYTGKINDSIDDTYL